MGSSKKSRTLVHQDNEELLKLLERVRAGDLQPHEAIGQLGESGFVDLGFAKLDVDRQRRIGVPEVVFCHQKPPEQVISIVRALEKAGQNILCTRVSQENASKIRRNIDGLEYNPVGRTLLKFLNPTRLNGRVGVVSGGTSDLAVAEEAAVTASFVGAEVMRFHDVGVAGLHRLLAQMASFRECDCLVIAAGMDGALPSVVGGMLDIPIIAVPTGVGYGASFDGVAALLAMLNSCSPGVSVVNIDNGFGAGYQAGLIARRAALHRPS